MLPEWHASERLDPHALVDPNRSPDSGPGGGGFSLLGVPPSGDPGDAARLVLTHAVTVARALAKRWKLGEGEALSACGGG